MLQVLEGTTRSPRASLQAPGAHGSYNGSGKGSNQESTGPRVAVPAWRACVPGLRV
jgi:hypothetical protein